ncbi:SUF system NifU family Fe-S cluster assembly protein [Vagococcus coleopterorum]|uniref:SUF system NifU family Fe-S cluster assembly protein n=1 Tax=Vagococcus coleopterorum TaxID=2714946 RepID=A0A6G8AMA0_9ENTE|nr:SUF system NifU family Fe-S cluster assembly protein [Vagococcus coleopterorum]QIL46188.1 SUF system NifU family Fe-S cluster assembly protein [Vagococcus coleopterorum]
MALSRLDNLYRQVILDHSSHPHHHGVLDDASTEIEMNNPTCGDVIQLQLAIDDNDKISDIRFSGSGCSISTASTSMMTDAVIGKTTAEALALVDQFSELVQGKDVPNIDDLGDAQMLGGVAKFPARIKCATLGWKALEKGIKENQTTTVETASHCDTHTEQD